MILTMNHKLLAAALLSVFLAACGGGGDTASSTPTPDSGTPTTPPPTSEPADDAPPQASVPAPVYASAHRLEAFNRFNEIRQAAGLGLLRQNAQLDVAAQGHSDYLSLNDLTGHYQNPAHNGFTGADFQARARAASYSAASTVGEVMATAPGDAPGAAYIDTLISTPYHRMFMLQYGYDELGVGHNGEHPANMTFNMGRSPGQGAPDRLFVIWPTDGAAGVSLTGAPETPNPIPENNGSPYGYTVSIQTHELRELSVTSFTLEDQAGNIVDAKLLHHTTDTNLSTLYRASYFAALIGRSPLMANTTYTARFTGAVDGQTITHTWSFTTGSSPY
jgi:uncharacterized protein YkwD